MEGEFYGIFPVTHRAADAEHVAVVFVRQQVLGDVGEVVEVLPVLTCAEDVSDLMLTDHPLKKYTGCTHKLSFYYLSNKISCEDAISIK